MPINIQDYLLGRIPVGRKIDIPAYLMAKAAGEKIQEITGTLPLYVRSRASQILKNYIIYGTSDGAGVETENGYKLPITVTSNGTTTDYPIYIGDSKLGEEEYVDYEEQKVYKRTENDFPFARKGTFAFGDGGNIISDGEGKFVVSTPSTIPVNTESELIPLNRPYTIPQSLDTGGEFIFYIGNNAELPLYLDFYDAEGVKIEEWLCIPVQRKVSTWTRMTGKTIAYIGFHTKRFAINGMQLTPMFSKNDNLTTYIPYLQPTDPPVPLPDITLPQGEVIIDIDGDIKPQATIKGKIKQI